MGVRASRPAPLPDPDPPAGLSTLHFPASMTGAEKGREVLTALLHANKSFIAGDSAPQSQLSAPPVRKGLAEHGQQPDLAIVTCADSRVSPEILFGAGLGRVFVIRNAGNVVWGDSVQGSLEYAVAALKCPLVMVLGHSACGAVSGAVATVKNGGGDGGPLATHLEKIGEVVESCIGAAEEIKDAVLKNVSEGVRNLREGPTAVGKAYAAGEIALVGAYYDLHSGEVAVIDE